MQKERKRKKEAVIYKQEERETGRERKERGRKREKGRNR